MDDDIIKKFRDKFMEEATMLLDNLEKELLELEKETTNRGLHESVFRAMHTIKGISAMYGFTYISDFTHVLENIFQDIREGKCLFNRDISEVSLESIDHIRRLLNDESLVDKALQQAHEKLLARIRDFRDVLSTQASKQDKPQPEIEQSPAPANKIVRSWYIIIDTSEHLYFRGIRLANIYQELCELGKCRLNRIPVLNTNDSDSWGVILVSSVTFDDISETLMFIEDSCHVVKIADYDIFETESKSSSSVSIDSPSILDLIENKNTQQLSTFSPLAIGDKANDKQGNSHQVTKRISVDTNKLDNLMHLVSQLITLNTKFGSAISTKDEELQSDYLEELSLLAKYFRDSALELRLVPLSDLALRFQRLIRDLAKSLDKKIEFVTDGIDNELDKNTIDGIAEPIMHLIRNCIDHGIETPEVRKQMGKPETGTIKLSASYSGNFIYIKIADDGNGIDLEKVRKKAIDNGLLAITDRPTEQELLDLIFLPGFSTAQSLSEVSGRGVGMDIVRKRIADLQGSVTIESTKGIGSVFTIKISQSMAIIDTLLFKVENDHFIIPIAEIDSCDHMTADELGQFRHKSAIPYNNILTPMIDLRKILKIEGGYTEQVKTIVLHSGNQHMTLLADAIIGEHQAVLKPLQKTYDTETFISSVSQLGNGKMAFLIDPVELCKQITTKAIL
jgi:two-component system, chemotaxis family, sensor kinase CheA